MKRTGRYLLVVCLAAVVFFSVASVALADTQTTVPGMTERIIWDTVQVAAYKVNVSHIGNLHAEVTFKPDWADFDIYIYNESCESVWEEPMGYSGMLTGKEVIDHYVSQEDFNNAPGSTDIVPEDPYTGEPEHLRGVDYYVIIVAYNETAEFQVWGYAPYTDLSTGVATVSDQWNWYFETFRFPGNKKHVGHPQGCAVRLLVGLHADVRRPGPDPAPVAGAQGRRRVDGHLRRDERPQPREHGDVPLRGLPAGTRCSRSTAIRGTGRKPRTSRSGTGTRTCGPSPSRATSCRG